MNVILNGSEFWEICVNERGVERFWGRRRFYGEKRVGSMKKTNPHLREEELHLYERSGWCVRGVQSCVFHFFVCCVGCGFHMWHQNGSAESYYVRCFGLG